jgi:hypothetical protein
MAKTDISRRRLVIACILGVAVLSVAAMKDPDAGSDFNQFYSAAKLTGIGLL